MNDRPGQRPGFLARFTGEQIAIAGMIVALALLVILLISVLFH